ncbi:MAG: O-antigen ligase family protein [Peptostreptococcaceae bacterium]
MEQSKGTKARKLKQNNESTTTKVILFTLLIGLIIIPSIIYTSNIWSVSPKIMLNKLYGTGYKTEIFNYSKSIALFIISGIICVIFTYKVMFENYNFKQTNLNKFFLIMISSVLISTIVSDYKQIALFGNSERFEGAIAWICYLLIFFIIYNLKIDNKYYRYIYFTLIPFLILNTILGLLDFYGVNILSYEIANILINSSGKISGRLMTTLYNPNFSSGLGGCIFVVSTIYLMLEKNNKIKISILFCSIMSFTVVLVSLSLSGFLTLIVLSPIAILISFKYEQRKNIIKWSAILIVSNSLVFSILYSHNGRIYDETFGFFERVINIKSENRNIWNDRDEESTAFEKLDSLSTGRMHIWKETLKLIKERPMFGYGFDTFPYTIDHDNPDNGNIFIDKPHNWYLTVWYGCGVLGLIGLLGIILWILIRTVKLYIKGIDNKMLYITSFGVVAYAFQGLFNDSFIGTSIFFWIYSGICANIIISNEKNR